MSRASIETGHRPVMGNYSMGQIHALKDGAGESVVLTGRFLQPLTIDNGHSPVAIADQSRLLQYTGGYSNRGTAHAEHGCQKLLGENELVGTYPVGRHQQPARATLFHR